MKTLALCAGAVALRLALPLHAARPLQTEDGGVAAEGGCELDGESRSQRDGGDKARGLALDLTCGLSERVQASAGLARLRDAAGREEGAGLGLKARLWQGEGEAAPSVGLAGAMGWVRLPGGGWSFEAAELTLGATLPAGGSQWHASLGHVRDQGANRRFTGWGLAWELEPLEAGPVAWAPMAEFTGDDRGETWFNAGIRVGVVADRLWLDLSWQRQVAGGKARGVAAGFKLAY